MAYQPETTLAPLDEVVDHVRGSSAGRLIVEYGDYECPYSRQAFREIERVEKRLGDGVRSAFRHFPAELELDGTLFDSDRTGAAALGRVRRDVESGIASGVVQGTPTLFIDGVVYRGAYDAAVLQEAALAR